MSEPSINPLNLLSQYQVPAASYDELARGQIPEHWQHILATFNAPPPWTRYLLPWMPENGSHSNKD